MFISVLNLCLVCVSLGAGEKDRFGHVQSPGKAIIGEPFGFSCVHVYTCEHVCELGMRGTTLDKLQSPIRVKTGEAMP